MILVVEDEEQMMKVMREALSDAGLSCQCASNGRAALELIEKNDFTCIILDLLLPEVDGFEVLRALAKKESSKSTKVIAVTGGGKMLPGWFAGQIAQSFGAHSILYKPFQIEELLAAVKFWSGPGIDPRR